MLAEAERAAVRAGGIAQQALAVEIAFALVELAGRGVSSRALASAEAAGRLSLVAQPLHAQAKALRARAAEQAYLVRAVALQKRPLVAGAEWLAERAVEGAAVARRVRHKRSPPRSWQAASSAAWPRLRRSQRSSCCPRPETLPSGRAAPAARSGRGRRRRRSNSNPPQDFPAWCRPVKAKAPGCFKGKDCKWKHKKWP